MTDFETLLSKTPPREIPVHWRDEILAAAERGAEEPSRGGRLLAVWLFFRGLLWPHPAAWAALAVCWLVIGALCFTGPRGEALYTVTPPGMRSEEVTPESYVMYLQAVDALLRDREPREPTRLDRSKL